MPAILHLVVKPKTDNFNLKTFFNNPQVLQLRIFKTNKNCFMRLYFLGIVLMLCASGVNAQDPHFSQFFASPLTLNPAFTGKFDGDFRVAGNYRNQWPTINRAYTTGTVSIDFPILQKMIPENDRWGLGLMGFTDKSAAGALAFNYFSVSTAYHKGLDEDGYHQLSAGFQGTYSDMVINTSKLTFEDQLTSSGFTGVTHEAFGGATLKTDYFDMNAGLLYSASTTDRSNFYAGVSAYHINRPKQTFTNNGEYVLDPRATFHAGGFFPVGDITTLHLSALYSTQAGAHETLVGGAFQFAATSDDNPANDVNFYAGAWMRLGDALIPYVGVDWNDLRLGATYDINTSSLKTASQGRGGIEISLIYIHHPSTGGKGIPCPRF
jgi:type IX secretion system PorP/SprF family membrane protein